jgi:hypothetical protein
MVPGLYFREALAWMERFGGVFESGSSQQLDAKRWIEDQKRGIRESGAGEGGE